MGIFIFVCIAQTAIYGSGLYEGLDENGVG